MDDKKFDALARGIAWQIAMPRRTALGALTGTAVLVVDTLHRLQAGEEAAAKGGSFGGRLGGRHGKNGRGGDKHRKRNRHHHKKKRRGGKSAAGAPPMNSRVIVENHTQSPIDAQGWVYNGTMRRCQMLDQETIQPNLTATFALETRQPFVWIKGKYLINVRNAYPDDLPYACLYQGGRWMSQYCYDYDNDDFCHLEGCKELEVGQKWVTPANACRDRIEIQRDGDVDNEHVFRIRVIA